MNVHLKIIVDNQAAEGLVAEHGLSMWIEAGGKNILFDAGQGDALEQNAARLGIDLSHADLFVLSHGHYDHTGAVDFVMQESPELQVFAHPGIFKTRYSIYPGKDAKEISMPSEERLIVANLPDSHLHWIQEPTQIAPGVWLTGPIPRVHPLEDTGGPFFEEPEGTTLDPIHDDQALWLETEKGLLVVCGCCHSGLVNTLNHIAAASGHKPIWGIVGGFHLKNASAERLEATAAALREFQPTFLAPCHCTGDAAIAFFRQNLKTEINPGYAGWKLKS
ncbi:MBL fold metallo-hydrolase [Pontiella sp.]|uniref:MBL fold metallo-hydrolase n=1 Tax=Pontiella sp. TaxID=2837462 RepID=UPI0035669B94